MGAVGTEEELATSNGGDTYAKVPQRRRRGLYASTGLMASNFTSLVLPLGVGSSPAWAEGTPVRVRGTVVSLDGSKLVVHAKDGKDVT